MRTTIGWLAAACAAATIALIVALMSGGTNPVHTATTKTPPTAGKLSSPTPSSLPATPQSRQAPSSTQPAPSSSQPAPVAPPAPGSAAPGPAAPPAAGGPAVVSMTPSSGPPGTTVTFTGSGLFSPSGMVTVLFGSVQARVSCPTQQTCVATAPNPAPGVPPAVTVTVDTDHGHSAPLGYTYTG